MTWFCPTVGASGGVVVESSFNAGNTADGEAQLTTDAEADADAETDAEAETDADAEIDAAARGQDTVSRMTRELTRRVLAHSLVHSLVLVTHLLVLQLQPILQDDDDTTSPVTHVGRTAPASSRDLTSSFLPHHRRPQNDAPAVAAPAPAPAASAASRSAGCHASCRRCSTANANHCLECKNPFHFLTADGKCDYDCPFQGYFKNYQEKTCERCHRWMRMSGRSIG